MWTLKNNTNEYIYIYIYMYVCMYIKNRNRLTDIEDKLLVTKGEKKMGRDKLGVWN